ncbi:hypothetical protein BI330_10630 [Mycobacterium sp. CBMA 623]|nr:hypothetical protein [Mycobacteroides sp. CBMA 326]
MTDNETTTATIIHCATRGTRTAFRVAHRQRSPKNPGRPLGEWLEVPDEAISNEPHPTNV